MATKTCDDVTGLIHKANAQVIVNRLNAIRNAVGASLIHPTDIKWQLGCLVNEIERGHGLPSSDFDAMLTARAEKSGDTK